MDKRLTQLIQAYQERVLDAIELMKLSGISLPKTAVEWATNGLPMQGLLQGKVKYFKHGYGCAVHLHSGVVDFDFGEHGEISGFDLWRLIGFAGDNLCEYGFQSAEDVKASFSIEISNGNLLFSGYILYYLID